MIATSTRVLLLIATLGFAGGCASEVVPSPAGGRKPTQPSEVKVYQSQPHKYELLGTVEVPVGGDVRWDEHGDATPGFEKLRAEAASHGANGLLLSVEGNTAVVTAGYKGTFYQVPVRMGQPSTAMARAIYVLKE
jgi:hypothetical protein